MTLETIITYMQNFYTWTEGLDTSPGYLLGLAALFAIAGLLALREAAGWFFKIDDLKRDLARIQNTTSQLEAEFRKFQALVSALNETEAIENKKPTSIEAGPQKRSDILAEPQAERPASFPIHH